jgi:5-formyltetrahydrofolate cyclo-ligase
MRDKADLRRALLAARSAIAADARRQYDAAIGAHVLAWWGTHPVRTLGIFWPMRGEPDLRDVYVELAAHGVQLALPLVVARDAPLQFAAWAPGEPLETDAMGVSIPARSRIMLNPEALLIPCVGFNATRVRLGYGGGYYDRTLAVTPRPFAIGIAYANGLASFEAAAHDVALDLIITEAS